MYLIPFAMLFPEIARNETRSITPMRQPGIPQDDYGLLESYCPDPTCDCQRVMLNVVSRRQQRQVATISYGFDRADKDAGPYLDPLNPQGPHAKALLNLVAAHLEADTAYVLRLKAHYAIVKAAAANPNHPVQKLLAEWNRESEALYDQDERLEDLRLARRLVKGRKKALADLSDTPGEMKLGGDLRTALEELEQQEKALRAIERDGQPARRKRHRGKRG
jgi:hypothetical protein